MRLESGGFFEPIEYRLECPNPLVITKDDLIHEKGVAPIIRVIETVSDSSSEPENVSDDEEIKD